jgi:amino acid adenylation domain-containing protein
LLPVRQDALRTTFAVVDEKPAARLLSADELLLQEDHWLSIENVTGCDDRAVQERLSVLASRAFDLEKGPLFRVHILSRSASEHVFLLVFHHIIADFWSAAVFIDDLSTAYAADRSGHGGDRPPPRLRYADFARWQHKMVAGEEGQRHWAYWRERLAGPLPVLDLPADHPRPTVRSYSGAVRHFDLDPSLTRGLISLGESRGASLYATLLAALQVFLGRKCGQDDVIVGTPVVGRSRPGFQDVVGYFVNLVPMRSDLSENQPFDEFLVQVRRTVAEGLEHQDFPFGLLVHSLQLNPDPSRAPLFQVMFAHQKIQPLDDEGLAPFALGVPGARLDLQGFAIDSIPFERQTALFDLTMMTARQGDGLRVALEYSTDLFNSSTIDRMADEFRNVLEAIVANPGHRLAELSLLSSSRKQELIGDWAEAPAIAHEDIAIHHRFERQVELSPDVPALICGEESITYRELSLLSNRLAHRLIELSVRPETVVGLYLDKWSSRIVGVLGVLKAGGAYLPLDTDHPAERLATMIGDSGATVLVTEDHLRDRLPELTPLVVTIDPPAESISAVEFENPGVRVDSENLAYVVFTSGSTGRPKGVMVSHRSLLAAATGWEHAYDLRRPPLRHLQAAGFAFDVFTGDWVRALTTGGTLVACPRSVLLDPSGLADLIRRERIECLELVPALADVLAAELERRGEDLGGVRLLAVGSDTLRGQLFRRLFRLVGPGGRVVNSYGLTEATIDSTYFGGRPDDLGSEDGPVPIGRPLPGTRAYVLDGRGEPVSVGVIGEVYIAGSGVARGYISDPRQTAERFVPDPYGGPGTRMYATGDRARWRERGVLDLLGRRDGQMKIRGLRVELAEIEAVLARHPNVSQTAVVVYIDPVGDRRLAAYVVPGAEPGLTASDLRRWLKDRVPDAMVPSTYVFRESLPLSSNGKLDRSALPAPASFDGNGPATAYVPPRTTAEEILAEIAADLLGRSKIGVHDNFFELGIDSIVGVQLVSRARQAGLALDPALLFRHPNVADLAVAAESNSGQQSLSGNPAPAIAPFELAPGGIDLEAAKCLLGEEGAIEDLYPLTPMQEGMLFHALADPEAGRYVEQFVCRIRGELDPTALQESWNRLVARHPTLRSTIHWIDFDRPIQAVHRRADHPVEYHDWRGLSPLDQDERLTAYLGSDRRRGFAPSRPPLSRLAVMRLGDTVHQLIWSIHHVVIDGWCFSVLLHELLDINESIRRGHEPVLNPVRPFRDYVAWLRNRDDVGAEEYWKKVLKDMMAATPLGIEGLSPGRRGTSRDAVVERQTALTVNVAAALQALARSRRLTLSTLIQGAWALLLARYSGRSDVLFGVAVSGRPPELPGVESIVGMFTNALPLRVAVHEEAHLVPWLRELQTTMVELRRFETVPLARIQAWSQVPPGMPLFNSIVIVQNLPFVASLQERAGRLGVESARYLERTHYPLAVTVVPGTELGIKIVFDRDSFDPSAIERMLGHLCTVLEAMTIDPERALVDLPLLTQSEQEQLVGQRDASQMEPLPDDLDLERFTESELDALIDQLR